MIKKISLISVIALLLMSVAIGNKHIFVLDTDVASIGDVPVWNGGPEYVHRSFEELAIAGGYITEQVKVGYYSGAMNVSGQQIASYNCSVTKVDVGRYNIVFASPISDINYSATITIYKTSFDDIEDYVVNKTINGFQLQIREQDNGGSQGSYRDRAFSFDISDYIQILTKQ